MESNVSPEGLPYQPILNTETSVLQLITLESAYTPRPDNHDAQTIVTTWDGLPTARTQIWSPDEKASLVFPKDGLSGGNERSKFRHERNNYMSEKQELIEPFSPPAAEAKVEDRVQVNWQRARKVCQKIRFEYRFRNILNQRDFNILQGSSLQDIAIKDPRSRFMTWSINPRCRALMVWKLLVHISIIIFTLIHTYRIAFGTPMYDEDSLDILTQTMELCFFLNILVKFFTGIRIDNDSTITDRVSVAKNYILHGTFFIDIISLMPFDLIIRNLGLIKLLRLIHLASLHRTFKFAFNHIFAFFQFRSLRALNLSRFLGNLFAIIVYIVVVCHFWACVWITLGFPRYSGELTWFNDVEGLDYTYKSTKLKHGSVYVYLSSLYFVVGTLTTNGFGDPIGHSLREHLISMCLMFFGLLMFTVFYEKGKDIMNNKTKGLYNKKVEEFDAWFHTIKSCVDENAAIVDDFLLAAVQKTLQHRIDHSWQHLFVNNEQYKHLNPRAKQQILRVVFQKLRNKFYILFRNLSEDFVHHLLMSCEPRVYLPNEVIILRGTDPNGLFLIREGTVALAGEVPDKVFNHLIAGSFFGEGFLTSNPTSSYYYIAENTVSCLFINEKVFESAIIKFSKDIKAIQLLAYIRETHFSKELESYNRTRINLDIYPTKKRDSSFKPLRFIDSTPAHRNILRASQHGGETPLLKRVLESSSPSKPKFSNFTEYQSYVERNASSNYTEADMLFSPKTPRRKANKIKPIKFLEEEEDDQRPHSPAGITLPKSEENSPRESEKSSPRSPETRGRRMMVRKSTAIIIKEREGLIHHHRKEDEKSDEENLNKDSDDELNHSDIYPLELDIQKFTDVTQLEEIEEYLEERVSFLLEKFKRIEKKMTQEISTALGKSKLINKKLTKFSSEEKKEGHLGFFP